MNKSTAYQNWKFDIQEKILWLGFDKANASTNTIDEEVILELEKILEIVEQQSTLEGMVIYSAKENGFIAGADIKQFLSVSDKNIDEISKIIQRGQNVCARIEALSIPTVAMIDGFCMGGGLELALACRYRVAEEGQKTRFSLPEVMLGIQPGWGGSVRLPRLIGAYHAMDMILTGRSIPSKAAVKIGLVDVAVPRRQIKRAVNYYLTKKPKPRFPGFLQTFSNSAIVRPILSRILFSKLSEKVLSDHYPAPFTILENWKRYGTSEEGYAAEISSITELLMTESCKNLVRVFLLQDKLKSLAKRSDFKVQHVHVIGAGTMGGDIAAWCALQGLQVTLQDREPKFIAPAIARAAELFEKKLKLPRLIQRAMDNLIPDVEGMGVAKADVIIEAIFEDLDAKQALLKSIENRAKLDAILATNTSSIPLDELNVVLKDPQRLVGIHFFNPVSKMMLVEVVSGEKTDPAIQEKAMAFVRRIDHLPLPVHSNPGFLVNRVLMPYLMEAMIMLDEKISPEVIDKAATDFGMPMGPIELADVVGLDVCLSVAENLIKHYGGEIPEKLSSMVARGELGRKTGQGFYTYKNGKPVKTKTSAHEAEKVACERLIYRLINEAAEALKDKVIEDTDLCDAGMIFGTGFAPFRGGPIQYARSVGKAKVIEKLRELQQKFGDRFKPSKGWELI